MLIEPLETRMLLSAAIPPHEFPADVAAGVVFPTTSSVSAPLSAVVGGPLRGRINVDLKNQAASPQKGLVVLNIYASDNGQFNSGDPLVASVNRRINLAAGADVHVIVPLNKILPATLGLGTDTLILQALDPAGNSEVNLSGGTFTFAQPHFSLSKTFAKAPPPALVSATKTRAVVQLQVTDNGNVALIGKTSISLYLSPDQTVAAGTLVTTTTPRLSIGVGHTGLVNVPLQAIPPLADGHYFVIATVMDPAGQISVVASSSPTVVSAPFVSLSEMFTGTTLGNSLVSGVKTRAAATLLIQNAGNIVPPGRSTIDLFASTTPSIVGATKINSVTIPLNIQPGASKLVRVPLGTVPPLNAGNYFIVAQVTDSTGGTSLAATTSTLTIAAPFISLSPAVAMLPATTSIISGSKINSAATLLIKNNGNVPSLGLSVSLLGSPNGQLSGATAFNSFKSKVVIPAGATRAVRVPLTGLSALASGTYFIVAEITDSNGGVSVTASSTSFTVAAPFIALTATIDSVSTPLGLSSEGVVNFSVTNNGNVPAGDPASGQVFTVVLDLLGQNGLPDSLAAASFTQRFIIAPGASKKLFAGFMPMTTSTPLQPGTYIPRLTVSVAGTTVSTTVTGTTFPIAISG